MRETYVKTIEGWPIRFIFHPRTGLFGWEMLSGNPNSTATMPGDGMASTPRKIEAKARHFLLKQRGMATWPPVRRDPPSIESIHNKFTEDSDALWVRYKKGDLSHAEYRARITVLESEYRNALRSARATPPRRDPPSSRRKVHSISEIRELQPRSQSPRGMERPIGAGYILAVYPYPFGRRQVAWHVYHSRNPNEWYATGEADSFDDAMDVADRKFGVNHGAIARDPRRSRRPLSSRPTRRQRTFIEKKIPILIDEGYPQRQAIAIAYRMAGVPPRRGSTKRAPSRSRSRARRDPGERRFRWRVTFLDYGGTRDWRSILINHGAGPIAAPDERSAIQLAARKHPDSELLAPWNRRVKVTREYLE